MRMIPIIFFMVELEYAKDRPARARYVPGVETDDTNREPLAEGTGVGVRRTASFFRVIVRGSQPNGGNGVRMRN